MHAPRTVLDQFIAQRVARRFASYRFFQAFGVTDLAKLSRKGRSFGVISAYRTGLSKKENQERHGDLVADLQKAGHHFHDFKASWEDMASGVTKKEKSVLVPNVDFKTLFDLGKKYEQDAVLYKDPSGSIGIYFGGGKAIMAFNPTGEMDVSKSTDRSKEYSHGRSMSFGLRLVDDKEFHHHGKPITQQDVVDALA